MTHLPRPTSPLPVKGSLIIVSMSIGITNLRQEITFYLRQALPHIPFSRHNIPSRWWILDTQADVLWDMSSMLRIEIFSYLTFF